MKSLMLVLLLILSSFAYPASKGINATVQLTVGSFQLKSSKIKGSVSKQGSGYISSKLYVKLKDLKSGIEARDKHMMDRIKGDRVQVTSVKAKGGKGVAYLEMNGIKKPIRFTYKANDKQFMATFKIDVKKDYQLKNLSFMGVGAKDIVSIEAIVPIK